MKTLADIRRLLLPALAAALLATACGGGDEVASEATTSTTAGAENLCLAPTYSVEAPPGWEVNDPAEASPCRYFNPEPFEVPQDTEPVGIAILLGFDNVSFEVASAPSPEFAEIVDSRDETVDSLPAKRLHLRSTGGALLDKGIEYVVWVVKTSEKRHFSATTIQQGEAFAENVAALDRMVGTLDFANEVTCSAAGMQIPEQKSDLPDPVLNTRRAVLEAAVACDYDQLAELASGHEFFNYSFGDEGDFAGFLQEGEAAGNDPLRSLVLIFGMTEIENELSNRKGWIWPAAAGADDWASVPQPQKDELLRLYSQQDLDVFAGNGAYIGYRTSIDPEGRWLYFVAGD